MFQQYLSDAETQALADAAVSGDIFEFDRRLWLEHIRRAFVLTLPITGSPLTQFRLDLAKLNTVERLEDGSIPLHHFLSNIAALLRGPGRSEAAVFERLANKVGNAGQGVRIVVSDVTVPERVTKEAIVHQDDTVPIGFLGDASRVARSVGRISVPRFENGQQRMLAAGRPWLMNGTGWLMAGDLFVTNHHVINARDAREADASAADFQRQAGGASVAFDFDDERSATQTIIVARLEAMDADLDYAIVRLSQAAGRPPLSRWTQPLTLASSTYVPVNIIQHPRGMPKRIAFRNNLVSGADADTIRYFTDTDFGSSGAPVCDDMWRVVALHRGAEQVDGVSFQGKPTAFVNFGTQIARLMAHLQQRVPALHAEILAANP